MVAVSITSQTSRKEEERRGKKETELRESPAWPRQTSNQAASASSLCLLLQRHFKQQRHKKKLSTHPAFLPQLCAGSYQDTLVIIASRWTSTWQKKKKGQTSVLVAASNQQPVTTFPQGPRVEKGELGRVRQSQTKKPQKCLDRQPHNGLGVWNTKWLHLEKSQRRKSDLPDARERSFEAARVADWWNGEGKSASLPRHHPPPPPPSSSSSFLLAVSLWIVL